MVRYVELIPNNSDALNTEKKRNIRNTIKGGYNCGGYALKTFSWYVPTREDKIVSYKTMTNKECVEVMLEDFPDLRVIKSLEGVGANEYAIAFRLSVGDFHYAWRNKNGHWFHKQGSNNEIETMTEWEVFNTGWCNGRYNKEIVLFAKGH